MSATCVAVDINVTIAFFCSRLQKSTGPWHSNINIYVNSCRFFESNKYIYIIKAHFNPTFFFQKRKTPRDTMKSFTCSSILFYSSFYILTHFIFIFILFIRLPLLPLWSTGNKCRSPNCNKWQTSWDRCKQKSSKTKSICEVNHKLQLCYSSAVWLYRFFFFFILPDSCYYRGVNLYHNCSFRFLWWHISFVR